MWLKLTGRKDKKTVMCNMNIAECVDTSEDYKSANIHYSNGNYMPVLESVAEIELMLKGVEPQKADPRSRDVIGRVPDNELSESDWNLRYNKP